MPVHFRDYVDKDLFSLVKLLNDARQGSYEFMPITEGEMLARIHDGRFHIIVAEDKGEVVGCAAYNDGFWGEEIRWLSVREGCDRKQVEDSLVARAEKFVRKGSVFTSVDSGSPTINDWIRRGYRIEGGLYQMGAVLDRARPLPLVPENIVLRTMKPGEEKQVVEVVNTVFGWERLKPDFMEKGKSEASELSEDWVHLADDGGRIVSAVASWPATKYNTFFHAKRGYLGPAATLPEYRAKKIASALTVRAMNFLFEKGMDAVVLHTSELNMPSVKLLRNIGFEVGHHVRFLRKDFTQKLAEQVPIDA